MSILLSLAESTTESTVVRIEWELLLSVVVAAMTGLWTLYTWRSEKHDERVERQERERKEHEARDKELAASQEQERNSERRRAALYTMPFMLSAESLQSRMYNILELGGLKALHDAYPNGGHADETLYLLAKYLGWARCMTRYTRFAYDEDFMAHRLAVAELLATQKHGPGLMIYRNDQIDIGRLALDRYTGEYGAEFDAIGERAFTEKLSKAGSLHEVSQRAVAGLRGADSIDDLDDPTRTRMAKLQHVLCAELERLEEELQVRVFMGGKRFRAKVPGED